MKLSAKSKVFIEHYIYGLALAVVVNVAKTVSTKGAHNYSTIAWSVVEGVLMPILIKANPKSLYNKVYASTGIPEATIAKVADTAIADVVKTAATDAAAAGVDPVK